MTLVTAKCPMLLFMGSCYAQAPQILHPLLDLLVSSRNSQAKIGLLHMCSFIILVLSSGRLLPSHPVTWRIPFLDRDFAVALNAPFRGSRIQDVPVVSSFGPPRPPPPSPLFSDQFTGTWADLMTLSIYRVVSDALFVAATAKSPTTGAESLIDMMLTSLCNM